MANQPAKVPTKHKKKKLQNYIGLICWIAAPLFLIFLLVLDGLGLYLFNTERLIMIGACIAVVLFPFASEITFKNISIKKDQNAK